MTILIAIIVIGIATVILLLVMVSIIEMRLSQRIVIIENIISRNDDNAHKGMFNQTHMNDKNANHAYNDKHVRNTSSSNNDNDKNSINEYTIRTTRNDIHNTTDHNNDCYQ